ncbi:MAG TPA: FlaD/FlaE family flagellar protein, partial [Candidatus Thermoplasmatota archaeon]|nr:FlaD/FlaE family flagellar protein [Candidatus Thermoplasmatota archaeon]
PQPFTAPAAPVTMMPPSSQPPAGNPWGAQARTAHLERIEPTFENHLVALNWANLLLRYSSPMGLMDLLGYYESLGWISKDVRKQLLAYAEGIAWNPNQMVADWRGNIDLHQRTLLFIERLKGTSIEEDNYRALRRDITRIMGEDRRV